MRDEYFWSLVEKGEGCWRWTGPRSPDGYGYFSLGGKTVLAHRHAYQLSHGTDLKGLRVHRLCTDRSCVRPDHLEVTVPRSALRPKWTRGPEPEKAPEAPKGKPQGFKPPVLDAAAEKRFWKNVYKGTDCWEWLGWKPELCGRFFHHDGQMYLAQSVAYMLATGTYPIGKSPRARCKNKACVNPAHLYFVTPRKRRKSLSKSAMTRLRRRHSAGAGVSELAKQYDVSVTYVRKILAGAGRE
jgi:hypothetical protein